MSRVVETIGVGGLANEIPEEGVVTGLPLVYRDLDLDLTTNAELRVRCKVGQGFEVGGVIFMLLQLGEFEGTYGFGLSEVSEAPFTVDELATAVTVTGRSASFDAIPFSNADEVGAGALGAIESGVAIFILDEVLGRLRSRIGQRIRERAEAGLQEIRDRLDNFPQTADEVVASAFVHISSLEMTVDDIILEVRSGVWHPRPRHPEHTGGVRRDPGGHPEPASRRGARRAHGAGPPAGPRAATWAEAYERYRTSLAAMLKADPELATAVVKALVEAAPVTLGLTPVLSPDLRRRARKIPSAIEAGASGELAEITGVVITLIESHDARRPLLQRAEQLAARLPRPPSPSPGSGSGR